MSVLEQNRMQFGSNTPGGRSRSAPTITKSLCSDGDDGCTDGTVGEVVNRPRRSHQIRADVEHFGQRSDGQPSSLAIGVYEGSAEDQPFRLQ